MEGELQPRTEPGKRFVALAEEHAADFATRAEQHDREGSFPHENVKAMQESGFLGAPAPVDYGGMGLESIYDTMIGMSRLARGDASTAIAANMHLASAAIMARIVRNPGASAPGTVAAADGFLKAVGAKQLLTCVPATEFGTDIASPMTEAVLQEDGSYLLNGRKSFGTMSLAAQILFSTARVKRDDGTYARALVVVPKGSPGVEVLDNWDALGMRASGSGDVIYTDCKLPAGSIIIQGEWGVMGSTTDTETAVSGNSSLVACFLGIAEAAREIAVEGVKKQRKGAQAKLMAERIPVQQLIAEIEMDLFTARAVLERFAVRAEQDAEGVEAGGSAGQDAYHDMMKDHQCMKFVLQQRAISIVDKAMTVSGGAGYMSKHPLARLYRDVRAGPFMQPFAPYEALEYIGKVALGLPPDLDR
jgi:alkylation response protein AidB-like acyl-CoA dehydrogenase